MVDRGNIVDRCMVVLAAAPAGLLTDIDGTISLIAPTPDAAVVNDDAKSALTTLAELLALVGVVTGRAAENAERMVAVPSLLYVGNHGLEHRQIGVTKIHEQAIPAIAAIADAMAIIERAATAQTIESGLLFENKGVTASVHYRMAPDQQAARAALLPIVESAAAERNLRVSEGRMVIELRPAVAVNKGSAVSAIAERANLRGLIFFGDDITDIDGFAALSRLRAGGQILGLNIAVVAPESPPEVAAAADVTVDGVGACVALMAELAGRLQGVMVHA